VDGGQLARETSARERIVPTYDPDVELRPTCAPNDHVIGRRRPARDRREKPPNSDPGDIPELGQRGADQPGAGQNPDEPEGLGGRGRSTP